MPRLPVLLALVALGLASRLTAAEPVPLFNGKDLEGWVNVNCHPSTFFVKDNQIVTTGTPTGFLRTAKQYENFILELDWMHVNKTAVANSGIFVWGDPLPATGTPYTRGIEVQVLINYPKTDWATNHGDVFAIHGATCKPDRPHPTGQMRCLPSEERVKGAGQWNHYKIVAKDGAIKLHVNGKEVSGVSQCHPRKGYLALESEGAECHFRNITIQELPSTNPKPADVADVAKGYRSLFDGLDLTGWKTDKDAWKAVNGHLKATGKADLVSEKTFDRFELVFDFKVPAKSKGEWSAGFGTNQAFGMTNTGVNFRGKWNRVVATVGKDGVSYTLNGRPGAKTSQVTDPGPIRFKPTEGLELMNVFIRELKSEKP
jgi:hypothetical protein